MINYSSISSLLVYVCIIFSSLSSLCNLLRALSTPFPKYLVRNWNVWSLYLSFFILCVIFFYNCFSFSVLFSTSIALKSNNSFSLNSFPFSFNSCHCAFALFKFWFISSIDNWLMCLVPTYSLLFFNVSLSIHLFCTSFFLVFQKIRFALLCALVFKYGIILVGSSICFLTTFST